MKNVQHHDFMYVHHIMFSCEVWYFMYSIVVRFIDMFVFLLLYLMLSSFVSSIWINNHQIFSCSEWNSTYDTMLFILNLDDYDLLFVITNEINDNRKTSTIFEVRTFYQYVIFTKNFFIAIAILNHFFMIDKHT